MNDSKHPRNLDALLDLSEPTADWSDADLAGMLRQQLASPFESGAGSAATIVGALLRVGGASPQQLEALKRLAKVRRAQPPEGVPADLWRVLYFAAIAAAANAGHRISELSPDDLRSGYRWVLSRPWLDPSLRPLLEQAATADPAGR